MRPNPYFLWLLSVHLAVQFADGRQFLRVVEPVDGATYFTSEALTVGSVQFPIVLEYRGPCILDDACQFTVEFELTGKEGLFKDRRELLHGISSFLTTASLGTNTLSISIFDSSEGLIAGSKVEFGVEKTDCEFNRTKLWHDWQHHNRPNFFKAAALCQVVGDSDLVAPLPSSNGDATKMLKVLSFDNVARGEMRGRGYSISAHVMEVDGHVANFDEIFDMLSAKPHTWKESSKSAGLAFHSYSDAFRHFAGEGTNDGDWALFLASNVRPHPSLSADDLVVSILTGLNLAAVDGFVCFGACGPDTDTGTDAQAVDAYASRIGLHKRGRVGCPHAFAVQRGRVASFIDAIDAAAKRTRLADWRRQIQTPEDSGRTPEADVSPTSGGTIGCDRGDWLASEISRRLLGGNASWIVGFDLVAPNDPVSRGAFVHSAGCTPLLLAIDYRHPHVPTPIPGSPAEPAEDSAPGRDAWPRWPQQEMSFSIREQPGANLTLSAQLDSKEFFREVLRQEGGGRMPAECGMAVNGTRLSSDHGRCVGTLRLPPVGPGKHRLRLAASWPGVPWLADRPPASGQAFSEVRFAVPARRPSPDAVWTPFARHLDPWANLSRVISFCLYGDSPRYLDGALANAALTPTIYPTWTMRVYHDDTVPAEALAALRAAGVELVPVGRGPSAAFNGNRMVWRFLVASDPTVGRYLVRDVDSRLSAREAEAVEEWIASGARFHVMRDHPSHGSDPMFGGLWGGVRDAVPHMTELLAAEAAGGGLGGAYWQDIHFLSRAVWPLAAASVMQHDSVSCAGFGGGGQPFPSPRQGLEHVGSVVVGGAEREDDLVQMLEFKAQILRDGALDLCESFSD